MEFQVRKLVYNIMIKKFFISALIASVNVFVRNVLSMVLYTFI